MRHRFTTNALGFLLKNATILLQHAVFVKKMRQYKEKLKDVLLDIYLKPLSNDLSSLFDKKSVVMVMYETSLKNWKTKTTTLENQSKFSSKKKIY